MIVHKVVGTPVWVLVEILQNTWWFGHITQVHRAPLRYQVCFKEGKENELRFVFLEKHVRTEEEYAGWLLSV